MDLKQLLTMLQGVSGPGSNGEYTAKCPAHDDQTASLTVTEKPSEKDGKTRIYLHCHAHCSQDAVMAALGVKPRDLIVNPDPPRRGAGKKSGGRKAAGGPAESPRREWGPDEVISLNGKEYRVRTVDEQGRPLDENGNVIPTEAVNPETGEIIQGIVVHTVGNQGAFRSPPGTPSAGNPAAGVYGGDQGNSDHQAGGQTDTLIPDWDHPDRVYSYTDEDGQEVFQVVRLHYKDGKPGKTFRQRMRPTEDQKVDAKLGRIKISRSGYVNSVPAELRDNTLYRLPKVLAAIAEGKPVYVVEGEKDVETLERLGHVATCNPGGAGKWREGYSRRLEGADVIILPDNDSKGNGYTGQNHALDVALKLRNVAKRVRLVDIKAACPELPDKGDISDMVELMGDVGAMDALARQVAATKDFDPNAVPFWLTPAEQAKRLYSAVKGYGVSDGAICQVTGETTKALCDFVVIPRMVLERDDGVNVNKLFVLDGWSNTGRRLDRVTIKAEDLDNMNWVTKEWDFGASLMPGTTTKGKVAYAIKKVGQMTAKRVTEYAHTGWRKIGGKWCYLYHGGAIGIDGITVDMGDALKTYRLDGSGAEGFDRIAWDEAARESLKLEDVIRKEIAVALLGTMYLAPLREWMVQTDVTPAFLLFLYGHTGTHKTTAASLALAHFGNFHAKNPPANFNDTRNNIGNKAFYLKDMPILVDDFHPTTSVQEKKQMSAVAQSLSRAFGDGADRGRLNADSTLKAKMPPRSVAVITGEDLPAIGASGLARFFILDIDKGDIPLTAELTELQEKARRGYLQRAMRGYILWLLKQTEGMPARLHDLFLKFREDIRRESAGQHDRAPEAVACILIGYQMMLNYMRDLGVMSTEEAARKLLDARKMLLEVSRAQAREMENEKPTRIFLDGLSELLSSKQVALKDLTSVEAKDPPPTVRMIGYMDNDYYYLLPNVAFGAVQKLCREQGTEFPVTISALFKHLRTDGILENLNGQEAGKMTKAKRIDGKLVRLLWIPSGALNGPKTETEQQKMNFTAVDPPEGMPKEWT